MQIKRLFEVSLRSDDDVPPRTRTLFVLADDEEDLQSISEVGEGEVIGILEMQCCSQIIGPSRVIGWGQR